MRLSHIAVALLACVPAACDRTVGRLPWQRGGLSFEQFVDATVKLRQAAAQATTPAAYEAKKKEIETRLKITDADLQRYVSDHARDVKLLSAVWDSVEARLGRAGAADAATRPVPQPPTSRHGGPPFARPPGAAPSAGRPGGPPFARPSSQPQPGKRPAGLDRKPFY